MYRSEMKLSDAVRRSNAESIWILKDRSQSLTRDIESSDFSFISSSFPRQKSLVRFALLKVCGPNAESLSGMALSLCDPHREIKSGIFGRIHSWTRAHMFTL